MTCYIRCAVLIGLGLVGAAYAGSTPLTLLEVEDGDTIVSMIGEQRVRLQLAGIDAPENTSNPKLLRDAERTGLATETLLPLGKLAASHLRRLLGAGDELATQGDLGTPDRYSRIPAVVIGRDGRSLSEAMVADGFAIVLDDPSPSGVLQSQLRALETEAIANKRGLWDSHPGLMASWSGRF